MSLLSDLPRLHDPSSARDHLMQLICCWARLQKSESDSGLKFSPQLEGWRWQLALIHMEISWLFQMFATCFACCVQHEIQARIVLSRPGREGQGHSLGCLLLWLHLIQAISAHTLAYKITHNKSESFSSQFMRTKCSQHRELSRSWDSIQRNHPSCVSGTHSVLFSFHYHFVCVCVFMETVEKNTI